jgi:uncharacterized delta-60 repeat protein
VEALEERTLLNGSVLDPTFGAGGKVTTPLFGPVVWGQNAGGWVSRVAVAPDGKIVLGGGIDSQYATQAFVTRYNPDGSLDTTFGSGGLSHVPLPGSGVSFPGVDDFVIQPDGSMVVSVHFSYLGGASGSLELLNADGSPAGNFEGRGLPVAEASRGPLAIQPDGKIFVVHYDTGLTPGGTVLPPSPNELVRLNPDGSRDLSFGTYGRVTRNFPTPDHLAFEPGGKIVGLTKDAQGGTTSLTLTGHTDDFSVDPTFGNGGQAAAGSEPPGQTSQEYLATQADGKLVVVVAPTNHSGSTLVVERFTADGRPDATLGGGTGVVTAQLPSSVRDVLVQPDGKILTVLDPSPYNSNFMLARFTADGQPDPTFGTNGALQIRFGNQDSTAVAAALQPDGNVVVAGNLAPLWWICNTTTSAVVRVFGTEPPDAGLSLNQRYVTQVYHHLLYRLAEAAGLTYWSGQLDQGVSRGQVVLQIEASLEYRQNMVRQLYREVLRREVEPYGLSVWADYLGQGGTIEHLRASLLGSPEYFAGPGLGKNDPFLTALYADVLNRADLDSAGQQTWPPLLAGGAPRGDVAQAILDSEEGSRRAVAGMYAQYLGRPADDFGLNLFSQALQQGTRIEDVIATLLASDEYLAQG